MILYVIVEAHFVGFYGSERNPLSLFHAVQILICFSSCAFTIHLTVYSKRDLSVGYGLSNKSQSPKLRLASHSGICSQIARNAPTPRQHFLAGTFSSLLNKSHTGRHTAQQVLISPTPTIILAMSTTIWTLTSHTALWEEFFAFFRKDLTFVRLQGNIPTPRERQCGLRCNT